MNKGVLDLNLSKGKKLVFALEIEGDNGKKIIPFLNPENRTHLLRDLFRHLQLVNENKKRISIFSTLSLFDRQTFMPRPVLSFFRKKL